ncbi:MAG: GNAT family N-acetyltransferase [Solirubrobacteraceae bacterium]
MTTASYPAHRETTVVLLDGRTVRVRPVKAKDEDGLARLLRELPQEALRLRFFTTKVNAEHEAHKAVDVDYGASYGVVALLGPEADIVGHASCDRIDGERAEVAFTVADEYQGLGLGSLMLVGLAEHAVQQGIPLLEAEVLPENHRMLAMFRESGRPVQLRSEPGLITVELPSSLSDAALEAFERREQISARAALRHFLRPREVAVITSERSAGTLPGELRSNVLYGGFPGKVHDLGPREPVPGGVELAVVSLEPAELLEAARACADAGVRALIATSSGSPHVVGPAEAAQLVEICRESGMRLLGPNCLGVLSTDRSLQLNASYGPRPPHAGPFAFLSQSAAIGLAALEHSVTVGLGVSSLVSVGDGGDISSNDLLHWWEGDERTSVIGLYLESFGNPRTFARLARGVARSTPIVAVKSGRTIAGARGIADQRLISASDVNVDALFAQAGIVRTDTVSELFDVAQLLATQPLPAGRRVAVLTNASGPGVLCADACVTNGLDVLELEPTLAADLARKLGDEVPLGNPLKLQIVGSPEQYHDAILTLGRHPSVDAVCAIHVPSLGMSGLAVSQAIRAAATQLDGVPLLAVLMLGQRDAPWLTSDLTDTAAFRVPVYDSPEDAARALGRVARYAEWRRQPDSPQLRMPAERVEEATAIVAGALRSAPCWLDPTAVAQLLACYGLDLVPVPAAPPPGLEMHVGMVADPLFGPVLGLGVGEPANELLRDVAVRITPVTEHDAREQVRSLRSFPLLEGYAGRPRLDVAALERVLLAASALVEDLPQIVEMDLDPLRVTTGGVRVMGARIRVDDVGPAPSLVGRSQA